VVSRSTSSHLWAAGSRSISSSRARACSSRWLRRSESARASDSCCSSLSRVRSSSAMSGSRGLSKRALSSETSRFASRTYVASADSSSEICRRISSRTRTSSDSSSMSGSVSSSSSGNSISSGSSSIRLSGTPAQTIAITARLRALIPSSVAFAIASAAIRSSSGVAGASSATNVPRPWRLSSRPSRSSEPYTPRTVLTCTPAHSASWRTLGSRSPGDSRPLRTSARSRQLSWMLTGSSSSGSVVNGVRSGGALTFAAVFVSPGLPAGCAITQAQ
jgi:trimeric autotransporter adhesin